MKTSFYVGYKSGPVEPEVYGDNAEVIKAALDVLFSTPDIIKDVLKQPIGIESVQSEFEITYDDPCVSVSGVVDFEAEGRVNMEKGKLAAQFKLALPQWSEEQRVEKRMVSA
jgi:hypothetical protein